MTERMLDGVRVIELGEMVSAPYAGRLLRSLGAEVIKIEAPNGDAARRYGPFSPDDFNHERSGLFEYLNAGKRSVVVDISEQEQVSALVGLISACDVVLSGYSDSQLSQWPINVNALMSEQTRLVFITIVSLGVEDASLPQIPASDLDASAISSVSWVIGETGRQPLSLPFLLPDYQAGTHGAAAAVAGLLGAHLGGKGLRIEIAAADVLAWYAGTNAMVYEPYGIRWERAGSRASGSGGPYPYAIFPCRDGYVCLIARTGQDWARFIDAMGSPEWSTQPRYQDLIAMGSQYPDEVDRLVVPLLARYTKVELHQLASEWGFPLAPLLTIDEVVSSPDLKMSGSFQTAKLPSPTPGALFPASPIRPHGTLDEELPLAPKLGEDTEQYLASC